VPLEITRFGVGHRRPEGPAGSRNVQGQVISSNARGVISELAFGRGGVVEPHANPNPAWFVVIEGGGFVRVGDEQSRVAAGEAVFWPPEILHGAWTDQVQMRAIVVEFAGGDDRVIEGRALPPGEDRAGTARAEGGLRAGPSRRYDPTEGEPF
jgi:quercetin dioxygenase-like cupin family protein